jgi:hypothetical protein
MALSSATTACSSPLSNVQGNILVMPQALLE